MCYNGIDEWNDGAAMSTKDVCNAGRDEGLAKEFRSGHGAKVLGDEDVVVALAAAGAGGGEVM